MEKEQVNLLSALNAYATKMKIGEQHSPIAFRKARLDDTLVEDRLITDGTIDDTEDRIESGHFESGNYFALTDDGIFVHTNEKVSQNMNPMFFVITERDLDKGIAYHYDIIRKLKSEIKYLKVIQEKTGAAIADLENTLNNP